MLLGILKIFIKYASHPDIYDQFKSKNICVDNKEGNV